jgi:hypothetical protein
MVFAYEESDVHQQYDRGRTLDFSATRNAEQHAIAVGDQHAP